MSRAARRRAAAPSSVSSAIPDRLSFASDGWQTWVVSRISSSRSPGSEALSVRERSGLERAVDHDLVLAVPSESSCRSRGRNPRSSRSTRCGTGSTRAARVRVQVRPSSVEAHRRVDRLAVAHDVEVGRAEVDDAVPSARAM